MERFLQEFENYIGEELGKSANTRVSYVRDLRLLFTWLKEKGIDRLEGIGKSDLQAYIDHLSSMHRSNATISRCVASIRQFFVFAKSKGYIFEDPSASLKAPKVIRKAPKIADDSDLEKLLKAPDLSTLKGIRDKAMLELMMSTGLRVSELISLRTGDVDLKKRNIHVLGAQGKERIVAYPKEVAAYMNDYSLITRGQMIGSRPDDGAFFVSCQGEKMTRQGFWKLLKAYGKSAKLKEEITPYTLRHSFAVYALKRGDDLKKLQNTLGHRAIYSTNEYVNFL